MCAGDHSVSSSGNTEFARGLMKKLKKKNEKNRVYQEETPRSTPSSIPCSQFRTKRYSSFPHENQIIVNISAAHSFGNSSSNEGKEQTITNKKD